MTEDEARRWVADRYGKEATTTLDRFGAMVAAENARQNLIAPSTVPQMWVRHLLDSAQLMRFAPAGARHWVDIGTGAGFPGIVTAILFDGTTLLVEPRARRAAFLEDVVATLNLERRISVFGGKAEAASNGPADVITARAVASTEAIFAMSAHLTKRSTTFILPRGRSGAGEVETLGASWHGVFHVEHSLTDPASTIIIASGVTRACSASR